MAISNFLFKLLGVLHTKPRVVEFLSNECIHHKLRIPYYKLDHPHEPSSLLVAILECVNDTKDDKGPEEIYENGAEYNVQEDQVNDCKKPFRRHDTMMEDHWLACVH